MESPVWTPMGSKFSMEQTMMTVVGEVADDFELELFPAEGALFDEDFGGRGKASRPAFKDGDEVFAVVGDATARCRPW